MRARLPARPPVPHSARKVTPRSPLRVPRLRRRGCSFPWGCAKLSGASRIRPRPVWGARSFWYGVKAFFGEYCGASVLTVVSVSGATRYKREVKAVCRTRLNSWSSGGEGGTSWLQFLGREKEPAAISSSSCGSPTHLPCVVSAVSKQWASRAAGKWGNLCF